MVLLLNPLKIRVDRSSFSWVSGHQRAPQYLQFILQLQWWIAIVWTSGFLQIFQWTLSALSRVLPLSDGWACRTCWYLYTLWLSVASSFREAQPFPDSSYPTPVGKLWPLTFSSPYFCITWGIFSDLSLIVVPSVCSAISNQLWTFKLNYFPQTEHIIPHMTKPLLLETIIFTILYESNIYSALIQCLIL